MTFAARAIVEKKTFGHLSHLVATRRQSLSLPDMISIRFQRLYRRLSYCTDAFRCRRPGMHGRSPCVATLLETSRLHNRAPRATGQLRVSCSARPVHRWRHQFVIVRQPEKSSFRQSKVGEHCSGSDMPSRAVCGMKRGKRMISAFVLP